MHSGAAIGNQHVLHVTQTLARCIAEQPEQECNRRSMYLPADSDPAFAAAVCIHDSTGCPSIDAWKGASCPGAIVRTVCTVLGLL